MVSLFQLVKSSSLVSFPLALVVFFACRNSLAQDIVSMEEAVWANADCHRNYDASFESTVIAEIPKDPIEVAKLEAKFQANGKKLWDEKQRRSRIVVSNDSPIQILFVSEWIWSQNGKVVSQFANVGYWNDGASRLFKSSLPPGVSIPELKQSQFYFRADCDVPVLEDCYGDLFEGISHPKDYFEDKELFRDKLRELLRVADVSVLPGGTIRTSKQYPRVRVIMDSDPVTSHGFFSATIPIDEKTGDLGKESS